jgi:hypothetical protein
MIFNQIGGSSKYKVEAGTVTGNGRKNINIPCTLSTITSFILNGGVDSTPTAGYIHDVIFPWEYGDTYEAVAVINSQTISGSQFTATKENGVLTLSNSNLMFQNGLVYTYYIIGE